MKQYKGVVLGGIPRERIDSIKNLSGRLHATDLNWRRDETGRNYTVEFAVKGPYMEEFVKKSLNSGYASYVSYLDFETDKKKLDYIV